MLGATLLSAAAAAAADLLPCYGASEAAKLKRKEREYTEEQMRSSLKMLLAHSRVLEQHQRASPAAVAKFYQAPTMESKARPALQLGPPRFCLLLVLFRARKPARGRRSGPVPRSVSPASYAARARPRELQLREEWKKLQALNATAEAGDVCRAAKDAFAAEWDSRGRAARKPSTPRGTRSSARRAARHHEGAHASAPHQPAATAAGCATRPGSCPSFPSELPNPRSNRSSELLAGARDAAQAMSDSGEEKEAARAVVGTNRRFGIRAGTFKAGSASHARFEPRKQPKGGGASAAAPASSAAGPAPEPQAAGSGVGCNHCMRCACGVRSFRVYRVPLYVRLRGATPGTLLASAVCTPPRASVCTLFPARHTVRTRRSDFSGHLIYWGESCTVNFISHRL